jgi:hypothetical protein
LPEWLIERGIGETRAALVDQGEIIEARIDLDGSAPAGTIARVRLVDLGTNGRNAIAVGEHGVEYLLPRGAAGVTQGATLTVELTREAIPGGEPWKRPLARVTDQAPTVVAPLAERLGARYLSYPAPHDGLGQAGWDDLLDQARSGVVALAGGELRISATPAMTLIDVDGYLPPAELAVLGASEATRAIRRFDIGGSIGIDLPTVRGKAERQAVGHAIDAAMAKPFERTAMNGFGFVQIVRPRTRPSVIELAQDRAAFEARALLRRAAFEPAGAKRLVAHPLLIALLKRRHDWIEQLARQVGGPVSLRADANLPMSAAYAENC